MENKKTKRARVKYSALDPTVNLKSRYELISDYDYIEKLNEKEKEWLNRFTKEYVNADLRAEKNRKNLHSTKALKKDCYDRNNARNRCVWTRSKASGNYTSIDDVSKTLSGSENGNYEDWLALRIDLKINKD